LRLAQKKYRMGRVAVPLVYKRIHAAQSFEQGNRLHYLWSALRERLRAARLFTQAPTDYVLPVVAFLYGLLPLWLRKRRM